MGDWDSLIWDLSRFDDNAMLSTTPFSPQPSVPVPEPATWLLLLLGTAFLLKRRMIR
ncbi:MAG: PEP-CTERM sorting domain-containing protein [Planctomycetia bacterium]|nr:PEP-CTERM sorting domain-containing protein [Planctomycetia bacterium]